MNEQKLERKLVRELDESQKNRELDRNGGNEKRREEKRRKVKRRIENIRIVQYVI